MDILAKLDRIYQLAGSNAAFRSELIMSRTEAQPLSFFCSVCRTHGVDIVPMDVIDASEEMYSAMKRATNGGGENSPELAYQDDYFELLMQSIEEME